MEIQKDLRLPEGETSWFRMFRNIMSDDELRFHFGDGKNIHRTISAPPRPEQLSEYLPKSTKIVEHFECDINTLKIRMFDELNDVLPSPEDIREMFHEIHRINQLLQMRHDLEGNVKCYNFLLKLNELINGK